MRNGTFGAWTILGACLAAPALAHPPDDSFRQLDELLPTPNEVRTASGRPGPHYWQQRADYEIDIEFDDTKQQLIGTETITYTNQSPHALPYLWVQLDPNMIRPHSQGTASRTAPDFNAFSYDALAEELAIRTFDGGLQTLTVTTADGGELDHSVIETMMRIDLAEPLPAGGSTSFKIGWSYAINDGTVIRERTGYEKFDDGNYLYEIAQWYPRMAAYTDVVGWQNKQFLGQGEFTLEYGDYTVRITVPDDHIVGATGVLSNASEVLTAAQLERLEQAKTAAAPLFVVTPKEAAKNEKTRPKGTKTWVYEAENVRDFAFASSRKFIWDAWGHQTTDGRTVMAMSLYPNEAEPLWSQYSTQAIAHTLEVYGSFTFPYPYPVAISVNGPVGGMEYPMICFNRPRPDDDGTYWGEAGEHAPWDHSKYGLIGVVIHEVGHNWFPMILNNDERQWTWLDEGLNTFLQFHAHNRWEADYPRSRGEPREAIEYMPNAQRPIMTSSDSIPDFGDSQYLKTATALSILRETIIGPEAFDFAFQQYATAWMFKRPYPADFFRIMEDAAGRDLDWFWHGWFFTTDHVDIALTEVKLYHLQTLDPTIDKARAKKRDDAEPTSVVETAYAGTKRRLDRYPALKDIYNSLDEYAVTAAEREEYTDLLKDLEDDEKALLKTDKRFYVLEFDNLGGLPMPVILQITWANGKTEERRIPAEIWMRDPHHASKLLLTDAEISKIVVDPHLETADVDVENNHWPRRAVESTFELDKQDTQPNAMQEAKGKRKKK